MKVLNHSKLVIKCRPLVVVNVMIFEVQRLIYDVFLL